MDNNITISKEEYERLLESDLKLSYLEMYGVDNWEGFSIAMSKYHKDYDNEED